MYRILLSNVETLKERDLENKTNEISIAVLESDIVKQVEKPVFYAYRYGMIYDPNNEFKPNIPPNQKIKGQLVEDYFKMLDDAREMYRVILETEKGKKANTGENKGDTRELELLQEKISRKDERIKSFSEQIQLINDKLNSLKEENSSLKEALKDSKKGEKVRHEKFDKILALIMKKKALYLYGSAGTGKSQLAEDIAEAAGLDFYPASTITQEFKLTGYQDANGIFRDTNFYKAVKFGGMFFLDEMDSCLSEVLVGINGCLANGYFDFPNETVKAHPNFRIIAAGNTIGRGGNMAYTGRQALDISTLDRFLAIPIEYSPEIDKAVAKGDMELVSFAHAVRKAAEENEIIILMSYRSIINITDLQEMEMFDLAEILQMAFIKGMASDDIKMLWRNMSIDSSNKYYKALKQAA